MWFRSIRDETIVSHILIGHFYDDDKVKEIFLYMKSKIIQMSETTEKYDRSMKDTFESKNVKGESPVFFALWNVDLLDFYLKECCPSGVNVLEDRTNDGKTIAHYIAKERHFVELLDYVVERVSNAPQIFRCRDNENISALDLLKHREKPHNKYHDIYLKKAWMYCNMKHNVYFT